MKTVHYIQKLDHGCGNWINMTHSIAMLHHHGHRIKCYFETDWIKELYRDWKAIEVVEEYPVSTEYTFDTAEPTRYHNKAVPDWMFITTLVGHKVDPSMLVEAVCGENKFSTYVPSALDTTKLRTVEYVAVVHGCANGSIHERDKTIPQSVYANILSKLDTNYALEFVGSNEDYDRRFRYIVDCHHKSSTLVFGAPIKQAVDVIANAAFVITNDSGLMHVTTALSVPCFALWKKTPWHRQKPIGKTTIRCPYGDWEKHIEDFLFAINSRTKLCELHDKLEGMYS